MKMTGNKVKTFQGLYGINYTFRHVPRSHTVIHKCQHIEVHMNFLDFPNCRYHMVHELYGLHMVLAVESLIHEID